MKTVRLTTRRRSCATRPPSAPSSTVWEVGMPEVRPRVEVAEARSRLHEGKARQRVGW